MLNMSAALVTALALLSLHYSTSRKNTQNHTFIEFPPTFKCRERVRLITSDRIDEYDIVIVRNQSRVHLFCHYCNEIDDIQPKTWFRKNKFDINSSLEEVDILHSSWDSRIYITTDHSLVINNVSKEDGDLYYCHGVKGEDEEYKFNYMIDVVHPSIPTIDGNPVGLKKYISEAFTSINKKFKSSGGEYELIRQQNILIHATSEWTKWGPCNGCTKIRKRIAECRLKPQPLDKDPESLLNLDDSTVTIRTNVTSNIGPLNRTMSYLLSAYEISCHSLNFAEVYPDISTDLMKLENYALTEYCYAPCRFSSGKDSMPKYKNLVELQQGDHVSFTCPEASLENEVIWRKNGIALKKNSHEGHVSVDTFSILYIQSASFEDQGNYTCYVDGQKIQEIIVLVTVQSTLTKEAFIRHVQYLGLTFLLSFIFYAAGIILAWSKRASFQQVEKKKFIAKPDYLKWKYMRLKESNK